MSTIAVGESVWLLERLLYRSAEARVRAALGTALYHQQFEIGRTMPDRAVRADLDALLWVMMP